VSLTSSKGHSRTRPTTAAMPLPVVDIAAGLRAIFFVQDDDGVLKGGGEGGQFGVDLEVAQSFADFVEGGDFFSGRGRHIRDGRRRPGRDLQWALMAEAGVNETRAIPFAEKFLRLGFHFFFFTADEGDGRCLEYPSLGRRDSRRRRWLAA